MCRERRPGPAGWRQPRADAPFLTNRLTGLLLIGYLYLYLYLNLGVLFELTEGAGSWARVLSLVKNHYFLALESVLILLILIHALNGLRVILVGTGIGVRHQKRLFLTAMSASAALYLVAVLTMFGVI